MSDKMNITAKNVGKVHPSHLARTAWLAWALCGVIFLATLANLVLYLMYRQTASNLFLIASEMVLIVLPVAYAMMAALIAARQPRNTIAWLLMIIAIAFTTIAPVDRYLQSFTAIPEPTPLTLICTWYNNWSWLLFIVPLFLLLLLFPTGKPPTPRLRWMPYFAAGLIAAFSLMAALVQTLSPSFYEDWMLPNPIGVIPKTAEQVIAPIVLAGLALLVVICPASLFYRYRRAAAIEREQIKWLLYTSAVFVVFYLPWVGLHDIVSPAVVDVAGLLVFVLMLFFPIAIAIAILRHRLWDIDVLIRRTLIYTALTVTLGLVFFGVVVLLQQLFGVMTGTENSPAAIVLSTLAIAALFSPLRKRLQEFVDRRFYRRKYDAEQALASFAALAREEVDLEEISARLLTVVEETVQPEHTSLWLKGIANKRSPSQVMIMPERKA